MALGTNIGQHVSYVFLVHFLKEICCLVRSLGEIDFLVHVLREIYGFSMFYMILLWFTWFYCVLFYVALLFLNLILFYVDFVYKKIECIFY